MEHYPAYTWTACLDEVGLVLLFLFMRIPEIHMRAAWPVAQLMAFVGNALGGKGGGGKRLDKDKRFSAPEMLPWFALTPELRELLRPDLLLEPTHCLALVQALEGGDLKGASWVLQVIELEDDMERIREVAEKYGELEE